MTAPALSWEPFGHGDHDARPDVPETVLEQARGDGSAAPSGQAEAEPGALLADLVPQPAPQPRVAGPAERALLEASRELAALHPLDRLEQLEEDTVAVQVDEPAADVREVPWAVPAVLDVLPSVRSRSWDPRDLVLPAVLLGELLAGVWLGTAKPWQADAEDPLQARFSSTAPVSDDVRLPGPAWVPGAVPLPASSSLLRSGSPSAQPSRAAARPVDPFQPR